MPKRSTPFQHAVFKYVGHLPENRGLLIEQSEMVVPTYSKTQREIDITVRSESLLTSIEVIEHGRRATVEWVERMIGKHRALPTGHLILYSASGFGRTAYERAQVDRDWITLVGAQDSTAEGMSLGALGAGVESLVIRLTHFSVQNVAVFARDSKGHLRDYKAPRYSPEDKRPPGSMDVYSSMLTVLRSSEAVTAFGLRNLQQDTVGHVTASLQADQLLARMPSGSKLPQVNFGRGRTADVVRIDAEGEAHTKVFHIDLTYKQLPKGVVAYGSLLRAQKPVGAVAILLGEEESSFDISVDSSVDGAFGEPNFALSIDSS